MFRSLELLIPILLSGYVFIHVHKTSRMKLQYLEGNKFYLRVIAVGVLFAIVGAALAPAVLKFFSFSEILRILHEFNAAYYGDLWNVLLNQFVIAALSSFVAVLVALLSNSLLLDSWEEDMIWKLGTELQRRCLLVQKNYKKSQESSLVKQDEAEPDLLEVSLKSGKVYIGLPPGTSLPDKQNDHDYLLLLPFHSGYREEHNKKLHLTTNYINYYTDQNLTQSQIEKFYTAIYIDEIVSVRPFNISTYYSHFKETEDV